VKKSITGLLSVEFAGRVFGQVFQYGLSVLIASSLGASALGAFAFGLVLLRLSTPAARLGLDTAVQKFVPLHRDDDGLLAGTTILALVTPLLAGVLVAGGTSVAVSWGADLFGTEVEPVAFHLLYGIPLFSLFMVGEAVTRSFKETKYAVLIRDFGQKGSALLFAAVAILLSGGIFAVADAYLTSLAVASALAVLSVRRLGAFEGIRRAEFRTREIYRFAIPVMGAAVASPLVTWTDILLLGFMVPSESVGYYEAAYQTALLLSFGLATLNAIFPPLASELYGSSRMERLDEVYSIATKWVTAVTLFGAGFVVVFATEILQLFGGSFVTARLALVLLVVGQVVNAVIGPGGYLLSMSGHERLELLNTVATATLNIVLNFVLIREFGILGAALATATSLSLMNLARLLEVRRFVGVWPYHRGYLRLILPLGVAFASMTVISRIGVGPLATLIVGGSLSLLLFAVLTWQLVYSDTDAILMEPLSDV
jgi:O-antigen/teichoic acid export membrane protein